MSTATIERQARQTPYILDDSSFKFGEDKLFITSVPESNRTDKDPTNLFLESFTSLSKLDLELTGIQKESVLRLLEEISKMKPGFEFEILETEDAEIQIYRKESNGYFSLIIDEYGGITYVVMGKKGFGYKCDYFENETLDEKRLYILSTRFCSDSL